MIMNTTTKTLLLLSVISLNSSVFGMLESAQKKMSTLVLSQKKQVAAAVLIPLTVVGCVIASRHKEDFSSLLEKIPMPSEKILFGLATAAAMPATYVLAEKFSPEEQFKASYGNLAGINNHLILKNKTELARFIEGEKSVAFSKTEKPITLLEFLTNNFSDEVDRGIYPSTKAADQLCDLERSINIECQRLQQIEGAGTSWVAVKKEQKNDSAVTVSEQLDQCRTNLLFIQKFRGMIIRLPEYDKDKEISPAIEKNRLTKDQITFATKIAAFIPLFIQPVSLTLLILVQSIINKVGLPYQIL